MNNEDLKSISGLRLQAHLTNNYIYKDSKILMVVKKQYHNWANELMKSGLIQELIKNKLFPETKINNTYTQVKEELIIEQELISFDNYFYTWTFDMIKDAAKTTLMVNQIANKYGYELRDAHLLNCMFYFGKCMHIDFDSFVKKSSSNNWIAYREFVESQVKILQLLALQPNFEYQKSIKGMENYVPDKIYNSIIEEKDRISRHQQISISSLKDIVSSLNLPYEKTMWSEYHIDKKKFDTSRILEIINIINKYKLKTVVDLASNAGVIAKKILKECKSIESVICIDRDHQALNNLYSNLENENILVTFNDLAIAFSKPSIKKHKGELVLCLALTHHLLLTSQLEIDTILNIIKEYSSKYVIIEFMPLGLYAGDINKTPPIPDWYNDEWFLNNFLKHFNLLEKKQTEINRIMYFGEIK
ncbi:MAG: methyltransferase [Sulfurimonas sp.]|nr:methyltransferase [Sulfurimonas sp.]